MIYGNGVTLNVRYHLIIKYLLDLITTFKVLHTIFMLFYKSGCKHGVSLVFIPA